MDTREEAKDKGQLKSMVGNGMAQCHHHLVTSVQTALLLLMSTLSCSVGDRVCFLTLWDRFLHLLS